MNRPEYIILHHSASPDHETLKDFDAIRRYHIDHNGWRDIGYHFVIEDVDGAAQVFSGRPVDQNGAHCPGMNQKSIGICMVGNYDIAPPPAHLVDGLITVLTELMSEYKIPVEKILPHRAAAQPGHATACPGKFFPMDEIKRRLGSAMTIEQRLERIEKALGL
jgi:N-acetylmuramoyl-L-alanine amidase